MPNGSTQKKLEEYSKDELIALIKDLRKRKKFGLVWEAKPEDVIEQCKRKLPVLEEVESRVINDAPDEPTNLIIEGDNYHALSVLNYTHAGKVDVIYIDPPYNTGNRDFKYNDKFVDADDPFRHSKWLNFIEKRLRLARRLMTQTGAIFISIDDHEQAPLRMLCDEIFGENNFVAELIWAAGRKNDSKLISVSHEYMLCYVASKDEYKNKQILWRKRKEGIDSIYTTYKRLKRKHKDDYAKIEKEIKEWFASLPASDPAKRQSHYSHVDERGIYFADNISWPGGGGPKYPVVHPKTKKPCVVPSRGWMFAKPEKMQEVIKDNRVHFGPDETYVPCIKSYLTDREYEVPYSIFYQDGRAATKRLRAILGDDSAFENPKDETVLTEIFKFSAPKNAIVLDFFAGSGTTGHAVLALNKEDGGKRQFILVTNNENQIAEQVTYPRIKKVIEGVPALPDVTGIPANVRYFKTAFVQKDEVSDDTRRALLTRSTEMICVREGTYTKKYNNKKFKVYHNRGRVTGILFDLDALEEFKEKLNKMEMPVSIYVFSLSNDSFAEDFRDLDVPHTLCPIPESILEVYRRLFSHSS